jgi:hypothetical protein
MKTHWTAALLAALTPALCAPAAAQTRAATDCALESPNRLELGGGIEGFVAYDGSVAVGYQYTTSTGETIARRPYTHRQLGPPTAFVGGAGYRYRITNHVFFEASAQALVPLGFFVAIPQLHAGAMVPIGR